MLRIKIISGDRKGEVLDLHELTSTQPSAIALREDEALHFIAVLDELYENLNLVLHEIETPFTTRYENNGEWVYEWLPKETHGRKECFFHNYYGLAELQLVARETADITKEISYTIFVEFHPVEIFAKKINAERVEKMLAFLARDDGRDLASAVRVTRIKAGHKPGGKTETFLLERIENNLGFLKSVLPSVMTAPLSKLQQSTHLVVPNDETLIDESSLRWISENPDSLYKSYSVDDAVLKYQGEYFSTSKVLEAKSTNSTDIYENQVLHGFVHVLINALSTIRTRLMAVPVREIGTKLGFSGYISLFTQISRFSHTISKNKVARCNHLMAELSALYLRLKRSIPVTAPCLDTPRFTQKAKFNLLYRQIFSRSIAWRRYGAPDWSFQDELFSIQSIPRLFEYYLFCIVKHHLSSHQGNFVLIEEGLDSDVFDYEGSEVSIRLMYEPEIWMTGHSSAAGQDLVNTEGWTTKYGQGETKISRRGSFGPWANRCPDIVIKLDNGKHPSKYIIIDAKYTDNGRAFLNYLPELTMKYVHGIHRQTNGDNSTIALIIVNPNEAATTRHFHHYDYSIYGANPVTPALLVSSIDVAAAHEPDSNFRRDLSKVINIGSR